jgi:phenylacetate-coenzyme A ligase PaaK-like adenylate-forming protein
LAPGLAVEWPPEVDDSFVPVESQYWDRTVETRDPEWDAAGVHPSRIPSLDDLRRLPLLRKQELRSEQSDPPPFGRYLCAPRENALRIHGTSGTTGRPTAVGVSRGDWRLIACAHAYTHLERESQPMLRLWSGDLSRYTTEPCACGRTYRRLPDGLFGRADDMLVIRGENVYPAAIEEAIRAAGWDGGCRVEVVREHAKDELRVRAEAVAGCSESDLQQAVLSQLKELGPRASVEIVRAGSLEPTEFKFRRISDRRHLSQEPKTCRRPRRGRRLERSTAPWRWAGLLGDRGGDHTENQAAVVRRGSYRELVDRPLIGGAACIPC